MHFSMKRLLAIILSLSASASILPLFGSGSDAGLTQNPLIWQESFANGKTGPTIQVDDEAGTGIWKIYGDRTFSDSVATFDADNGMIGMIARESGESSRLLLGPIDLAGSWHPALSFQTYNFKSESLQDSPDNNLITILIDGGDGYEPIRSVSVTEVGEGTEGWNELTIDLSDFRDDTVKIALEVTAENYSRTLIDALTLRDLAEQNICLTGFYAPAAVRFGQEIEVFADVANKGIKDIEEFDLILNKDGVPASTLTGLSLAAGESRRFVFNLPTSILDDDTELYVELNSQLDEDLRDNAAGPLLVKMKETAYAPVREINGAITGNGILISWVEPDAMEEISYPVTETFEYADTSEGFPTEFEEWLFVDRDGGSAGGFKELELPGIGIGTAQSFWVNDSDHEVFGGNGSMIAYSGRKCLAQIYSMGETGEIPVKNDDWAISPLLSEEAQRVTFQARSYGEGDTAERFEFLYSMTDVKPESFFMVEEVDGVPNRWTEYSFDVPEGARYFAVRCTSEFAFMLLLDDFSFTPASGRNIQLEGYNVYVRGEKMNWDGPLKEVCYEVEVPVSVDEEIPLMVTAVYNHGESAPLEETLIATGMGAVKNVSNLTTEGQKIVARSDSRERLVVYGLDGREVYSGMVEGRKEIVLAQGIYIIRFGERQSKIQLR